MSLVEQHKAQHKQRGEQQPTLSPGEGFRAGVLALALVVFGAPVLAQTAPGVPAATSATAVESAQSLRARMRALSDTELTNLTAQWAELSPSQRRALQTEVLGRMARASAPSKRPVISIRRQYGQVVRKQDGSVVVRTQVVRVKPVPRADGRPGATFGAGFERRKQEAQAPNPEATVPVTRAATEAVPVPQD